MNGNHTYHEITSQADAWEGALATFGRLEQQVAFAWDQVRPSQIVVIGCGSTYYLAQTAARLLQSATAVPTQAVPSSEMIFFTDDISIDPPNTLLIAISRSGTTSETLEAVRRFKHRHGGNVWVVTCYPDSPLAQSAALVLSAEEAQEQSVAQTRSFTSMLVLVQALAAHLTHSIWQDMTVLPDIGRSLLQENDDRMAELATKWGFEHVVFLGSGTRYGVASEAMLKMMEMSLTPSQTFHFMEYRHGPMSMVGPETLIVGLLSRPGYPHEGAVLNEMAALGASTLVLNPTGYDIPDTWEIKLPADLREEALPVLYLPPLQLLAYHRALAKGLDPDNPRNLTAVIELDAAALGER